MAELATELRNRIYRARNTGNFIEVWNFVDIHAAEIVAALRRYEAK